LLSFAAPAFLSQLTKKGLRSVVAFAKCRGKDERAERESRCAKGIYRGTARGDDRSKKEGTGKGEERKNG
jgi:hypothetical protein